MQTILKQLLAAALALSFSTLVVATPDFHDLTQFIQKTKDLSQLQTGTAVAVVKDGKIIYESYFGFADINAKKRVDRDTAFYIASTTKPFLALNVLLKEQAGQLDTRASLQTLFPQTKFNGFAAKDVTIKDLLVHTSGIDNQPLVWATAFSGLHDAHSRNKLVANSYPADKTALGTFNYTNVGYNIVSVWLDQKFGKPWQDQLKETIFAPLGMTKTSAYISEAKAKAWPLAKPYSILSRDRNEALYLEKSDETMQAAGGLISTAPDLAAFLIAQLDSGKLDGKAVFPSSVIDKSQTSQALTDGEYLDFKRRAYAWGWYAGEYKGKQMLHHFGSFSGFHAHLSFIPAENVGLVVLNNEDFLSARLSSLIADYAYGVVLHEADINAKLSRRFEDLWAKAAELENAVRKEQEKIQRRAWDLSQPHQAYVGKYSNALLGDMMVTLNDEQKLQIRWGKLNAVATGYDKKDVVRVEFSPNSGDFLSFVVNEDKVDAINFEKMHFKKVL